MDHEHAQIDGLPRRVVQRPVGFEGEEVETRGEALGPARAQVDRLDAGISSTATTRSVGPPLSYLTDRTSWCTGGRSPAVSTSLEGPHPASTSPAASVRRRTGFVCGVMSWRQQERGRASCCKRSGNLRRGAQPSWRATTRIGASLGSARRPSECAAVRCPLSSVRRPPSAVRRPPQFGSGGSAAHTALLRRDRDDRDQREMPLPMTSPRRVA
jgi:hypothetical protein